MPVRVLYFRLSTSLGRRATMLGGWTWTRDLPALPGLRMARICYGERTQSQ